MYVCSSRWIYGLVACLCLGLGVVGGCGDDDSAGNNNNITQQDAGVDAATGESVTFLVQAWSSRDGSAVPAQGATVAFDAPGGERQEVDTGADGRATFHGVDWTLGDAAVTAFLQSYVIISVVNLDSARVASSVDGNGDFVIDLEPLSPEDPPMVTVSGSATGLADVSHRYVVNTTNTKIQGTEWNGIGAGNYSIEVPANEPFVIQSFEFEYTALPSGQGYDQLIYNVMHMDYGPLTANQTNVELDFGTYGMTTHTADVSMLMPPRADSPLRTGGIPYCYFCAGNSVYCHGWPTYVDVVDSQNRIDISFLWVEPAYVQDPSWFCNVSASSGEAAQVFVSGTPQQDAQGSMIDTPTWVTPADPTVVYDLHAPLEWQWYENVTMSGVGLVRAGINYWVVIAGENATTATVPQPPTGVDEVNLVGTSSTITVFGGQVTGTFSYARYAQGFPVRTTL